MREKTALLGTVTVAAALLACAALAALTFTTQGAARGTSALRSPEAAAVAASAPERRLLLSNLFHAHGELLPSTYLNYIVPTPQTRSWFSLFEAESSGPETFFAVQRTQYGYLGIQETRTFGGFGINGYMGDPYQGIVIFSAWDTAGDSCQTLSVGYGAYKDDFTGEGTGCQVKYPTSWGNRPYAFMTTEEELPNGRLKLAGYWFDMSVQDSDMTEHWNLVGTFSVKPSGQSFGKGISAFVEQFISVASEEVRMAKYGPQFMEDVRDGTWKPITEARFDTTDSNHPEFFVAASVVDGGSKFAMGTAGVSRMNADTPEGTSLTLNNPTQPSQSIELQAFIRLRETGNLPQGCEGVETCGRGLWGSLLNAFGAAGPLLALLIILSSLLVLAVLWTVYQCYASASSGTVGYTGLSPNPDMRNLRRNMVG